VAARGLDVEGLDLIVNYELPSQPEVYVHRIGRTGRVGRKGRAITFVEPRQQKELLAIEEHTGVTLSPWEKGASVVPAPIEVKPKRHSKPQISRSADEEFAKLIAGVGRADGVEVADLVSAVTQAAALDGEAVRDVKVLERFSLLSVPESDADRVVAAIADTQVKGHPLTAERARA